MAIPDDELAAALRTLLRMTTGFYIGFAGMLEIGQLENLNYWLESKDHKGVKLWYKDDISLEEAIAHFLRIRRERELGYDIEIDLNPELGHIGPRKSLDTESSMAPNEEAGPTAPEEKNGGQHQV